MTLNDKTALSRTYFSWLATVSGTDWAVQKNDFIIVETATNLLCNHTDDQLSLFVVKENKHSRSLSGDLHM